MGGACAHRARSQGLSRRQLLRIGEGCTEWKSGAADTRESRSVESWNYFSKFLRNWYGVHLKGSTGELVWIVQTRALVNTTISDLK
jgi:hypothetical protein